MVKTPFANGLQIPSCGLALSMKCKRSSRPSDRRIIRTRPSPAFKANRQYDGKTIPEIAAIKGKPKTLRGEIDTILEMIDMGGAQMVYHSIREMKTLRGLVGYPNTAFGSDGSIREFGVGKPHPRSYGTNARVLARYVREKNVLTLEDAIRRMTSLPARTFSLKERGLIKPGMAADLVLFDPARVEDKATFADPHGCSDRCGCSRREGRGRERKSDGSPRREGGPAAVMIQLTEAGKRFGHKLLFQDLDWMITSKDHVGLVGGNGTGKSGEPEDHRCIRAPGLRVAHDRQRRVERDIFLRIIDAVRQNGVRGVHVGFLQPARHRGRTRNVDTPHE